MKITESETLHSAAATDPDMLLSVENLEVHFDTLRGTVKAVRNVSFQVSRGITTAIVGESGCGKSVTAHAINRLIPVPPGKIAGGRVLFDGVDLIQLDDAEMNKIRGRKISMIFQEPMTSLNPVFRIGNQIADVFLSHEKITKEKAWKKAVELLDMVRIPSPAERARNFPHQLSGGMRQRVMIAMALASPQPQLLIADEPTTALDVTIQAQILQLLSELRKNTSLSVLLITHDMGVVAENADKVIVMYAGRKVEEADVNSLFENPQHPYTQGLLRSFPAGKRKHGKIKLKTIPGTVPDLISIGSECPFYNRCDKRLESCKNSFPEERKLRDKHSVWCHAREHTDV